MGAEQSIPRASGQPAAAATHKTCYYEVLGVDRQAADDEIRRAYKKKALELHPDRNFNDTENATRKFAEVQTAYEILSDPQERAWYDSHRDAILGGGPDLSGSAPFEQSSSRVTSASAIFMLMGRFNSSVPMNDSPSGFFGILNAFFDQLASEETRAAEWDGVIPVEYPPFGMAQDDYDEVAKPFYKVWSGFSTKKSFSWMDKYRLSNAPDRRIRRLMEKENKKLREEGIRQFNDAVLSLVSFVRKRDPRYIPNTQSEAERQQILRSSAAQQAARSRAAHQEKLAEYVIPDWAQSRDDADQNDEFSMSEEESEVEEIECVVCNKTFKSEKQFEAHEKSKKHIKAVQEIKRQMRKENAKFDLQDSEPRSGTASIAKGGEEEEGEGEDIAGDVAQPATSSAAGHTADRDPDSSAELEKREHKNPETTSPYSTEDDEYAPRLVVENHIASNKDEKLSKTSMVDDDAALNSATASISDMTIEENGTNKKVGKAKLKRDKKAARQAANAQEQDTHNCAVCKETFASRTKLFSHIKEFNHAAPFRTGKAGKNQKR
ncbi:DnaJ subfamily C member 21 [Diplogelasinospora grovesii]|uniref:DnaJ subfamily C member 21 n=1 Tax=Diplogelasinospora grovesii TaxID=303347 RepID=A0AAN6S603_9PEZI|nr:DnaJ subfamily C member 21 [Diplogelasinospora grovesii]